MMPDVDRYEVRSHNGTKFTVTHLPDQFLMMVEISTGPIKMFFPLERLHTQRLIRWLQERSR